MKGAAKLIVMSWPVARALDAISSAGSIPLERKYPLIYT